MIRTKFDDLLREKEYQEKRRWTFKAIAAETGLAVSTIQRLKTGDAERVYLTTIDRLCAFFGLAAVGELLEYVPDGQEGAPE